VTLRDNARHRKSPLRFDRLEIRRPSFAHSRKLRRVNRELRSMIPIKQAVIAGSRGIMMFPPCTRAAIVENKPRRGQGEQAAAYNQGLLSGDRRHVSRKTNKPSPRDQCNRRHRPRVYIVIYYKPAGLRK